MGQQVAPLSRKCWHECRRRPMARTRPQESARTGAVSGKYAARTESHASRMHEFATWFPISECASLLFSPLVTGVALLDEHSQGSLQVSVLTNLGTVPRPKAVECFSHARSACVPCAGPHAGPKLCDGVSSVHYMKRVHVQIEFAHCGCELIYSFQESCMRLRVHFL